MPVPTVERPTAAELVGALATLEGAIVALATAYHDYLDKSDAVLHTLPPLNSQLTHAHTIGAARLSTLVAFRLRALGLEPVLVAAKRPGMIEADWVEALTAKLEAHVPEPVA